MLLACEIFYERIRVYNNWDIRVFINSINKINKISINLAHFYFTFFICTHPIGTMIFTFLKPFELNIKQYCIRYTYFIIRVVIHFQ